MDKKRALKLLRRVLEFEYEELSEGEDHKLWAMDMFDISAEEYDEIFKDEYCFIVEERGRERHEGEFTTTFFVSDNYKTAIKIYQDELKKVLSEEDFFLRDEVENGKYEESECISSNDNMLPLFSIQTDWEYYELYVGECGKK